MRGIVISGKWLVVSRREALLTLQVENPLLPGREERVVVGKELK